MENNLTTSSSALTKEVTGPNLFEAAYFAELQRELRLFLKSRYFTTVEQVHISVQGQSYVAYMACNKS